MFDYNDKKRLGIYVHVPFCKSKCAYCDFNSSVCSNTELMKRYVSAVISHMSSYKKGCADYSPDTVFIGGGTPTALPREELVRLIKGIKKSFDLTKNAEFTVEANPATVTLPQLKQLPYHVNAKKSWCAKYKQSSSTAKNNNVKNN